MLVIAAPVLLRSFSMSATQSQQLAQTAPLSPEMITVPVVLHGKDGQLINNLHSDQFRLFENGKEQKIALFAQADLQAVNMGFLMQWSFVRRYELPYGEIGPASQFFRSLLHNQNAAFVARFSDGVTLLSDFVEDPTMIEESLRQTTGTTFEGRTALYDAIIWACQEKLLARSGRRVLLLVTSGIDATGTDTQVARRRSEALKSALQTETAIYFIHLADSNRNIQNSHLGREVGVLAEQTGGDIVFVRTQSDLNAAFDYIAAELRSAYVLGYHPDNSKKDGKFRKIQIRPLGKNMHVQARQGYYATTK